MYYVISCDEDGEVDVRRLSKEELVNELNDKESNLQVHDYLTETQLQEVPDPQYWGGRCGGQRVIIKGKLVVPQEVERVTLVEVE